MMMLQKEKKVNKLLIAVSYILIVIGLFFVTGQSTTEPKLKSIKEQVSISEIEKQYNLAKSQNPVVAAFIDVPGVTTEAVVYTPEDQTEYLRKALDGSESEEGTLLMGTWSKGTLGPKGGKYFGNSLIFGHNTITGQKFGNLKNFLSNEALSNSPLITTFDGDKIRYYKFSFVNYIIDGEEFIKEKEFKTLDEMKAYNQEILSTSIFQSSSLSQNVTNKPMLYLQTCKEWWGIERYTFACVECDEKGQVLP